jgi:hypothetical protein
LFAILLAAEKKILREAGADSSERPMISGRTESKLFA